MAGAQATLLYPIPIVVAGSVTAAAFATFVACPFLAVKTRMIVDEQFAGGSLALGMRRFAEEEGVPTPILLLL